VIKDKKTELIAESSKRYFFYKLVFFFVFFFTNIFESMIRHKRPGHFLIISFLVLKKKSIKRGIGVLIKRGVCSMFSGKFYLFSFIGDFHKKNKNCTF